MLSSPNILWQLWQQHTGSKWFPSMYTGFSSVKWCYLNALLVPPALRHDPHNSAPTCARLPTRNSIKYRETNTRTVPNARRIQKWNHFTLVVEPGKPWEQFRILIFRSIFFFPFSSYHRPERERASFCCTFILQFSSQVSGLKSILSFPSILSSGIKLVLVYFVWNMGQNAPSR